MTPTNRHKIAVSFALVFIIIVSAPTVILTMDDSVDVTFLYGENEEEENLKLHFDFNSLELESQNITQTLTSIDVYKLKKYSNPHFNLIFPPPDSAK